MTPQPPPETPKPRPLITNTQFGITAGLVALAGLGIAATTVTSSHATNHDACQHAAVELLDIARTENSDIIGPLVDANSTITDYAAGNLAADIDNANNQMRNATDTLKDVKTRVENIGGEYKKCVQ